MTLFPAASAWATLRGVGMRLLALAVVSSRLAMSVCACAEPKVSLGGGPREYVATDYTPVLKRWTREQSLIAFSDLEDKLTVTATYESWDFRWAYVVRYAADYRLTIDQRRELLERTLHETEDTHEFYVALYGTKWRWSDLEPPDERVDRPAHRRPGQRDGARQDRPHREARPASSTATSRTRRCGATRSASGSPGRHPTAGPPSRRTPVVRPSLRRRRGQRGAALGHRRAGAGAARCWRDGFDEPLALAERALLASWRLDGIRVRTSLVSMVWSGASMVWSGASMVRSGPSMVPSDPSMVPSDPSMVRSDPSMVPAGTSMVPSGASMVPSGASMVPAGTSMVPSGASMVPAGTSMVPSGASMVPAGTSMVRSDPSMVPAVTSMVPFDPSSASWISSTLLSASGRLRVGTGRPSEIDERRTAPG